MDLRPIQHPDADAAAHPQPDNQNNSQSRATRSSARVKAAKEKEQAARDTEDAPESSTRTQSKPKRTAAAKGKGKDTTDDSATRPIKRARRATFPTSASGITITEPTRDLKGKKRAEPDSISDDETGPASSISAPVKRAKTSSAYSLRSDMPRKTKAPAGNRKASYKGKAPAVAGPSHVDDEDAESMMNADMDVEPTADEDVVMDEEEPAPEEPHAEEEHDDDDDDDEDDEEPPATSMEDAAAMAIFGDYARLGSYMLSMSSRLKSMLSNIKTTADPTTRLVTLQELSELLSISTEDTLAGSFPVEQYVRELVKILGGTGNTGDEDEEGDEEGGQDEDAALAAALAMSGGSAYQGDENLEAQVLACRCLANLMEALPGVAHTIVYHGALPVLCSKLLEISYIDLAEQTLSTLEKISEEFPSSIVREGGLAALLNYLDFFSIAVQRTALQAASNCCRNISAEHVSMVQDVWPIIRNCLGYGDQRLVEYACLCVIRVIDAYHRAHAAHLEALVDIDLIRAVNLLLLPAGGSPLIASNTFTLLLRALAVSARASPKITLALLEADIVATLYQILTGVLPPAGESHEEQGSASGGQGLGGGLADMTVMENLAHRPKDQVEEALSLISELMPPLPKDGVFDHKTYSEKSLARMVKAKVKAERAAARQAAAGAAGVEAAPAETLVALAEAPASIVAAAETPNAEENAAGEGGAASEVPSEAAPATTDRTAMLRSKPELVGHFMTLMVPILVDVYAASVITPVRIKTLTGLLKAVSFLDDAGLQRVLANVPVASFASSILSSKDHPTLVIGALQLVEMLLTKVPDEYTPAFHREGVFHEIESLASRDLIVSKTKEKEKEAKDQPAQGEAAGAVIPPPKKASSTVLDPEDAVTLRARVIRFRCLSDDKSEAGGAIFKTLHRLVEKLSQTDAPEEQLVEDLATLADLFASPDTSISSFELSQSGLVDCLLSLATDPEREIPVTRRQQLFFEAFTARQAAGVTESYTPLSVLVKKLQESLTRMESYEVITVSQGSDDNKRSSPSLLARQLRLRLVAADDSDIPRNLQNIVVSIHAIATFQALHDYLRPRVSGLLSGNGSRLLAALAAGFGASGSSARSALAHALPPAPPEPGSSGVTRRRSLRLSAKKSVEEGDDQGAQAESSSAQGAETNSTVAEGTSPGATVSDPPASRASEMAPSETLVAEGEDEHDHEGFSDEDVDAEVVDDEMDTDNPAHEKTITLSVTDDGSGIEAQTPQGTRVATPSVSREVEPSPQPRKASYAAALKAKPTDWHLEFSMDDVVLPVDLTIYGAIHQHELRKKEGGTSVPASLIWQGIYSVQFKKVSGPAPNLETRVDNGEGSSRSRTPVNLTSLPEGASHSKILRLLRVLHRLNLVESEKSGRVAVTDSTFVNNKLSAKLSRQLEEPMIVASSCLPDWALDLPQHFPFLFPFATRYNFLQSTSFGYARLILKWQSQQQRGQDSSRRDDSIAFLGRLQRQKVRISRKHILESAMKVFELYGSSSSVLEVEYFEEAGTGLGPTLEFYSLVSREFARRNLKLWRDADANHPGVYVHHPKGLFPAPLGPEDPVKDAAQKRTHIFRVIGQFVAKAMLDSRIIDMSYNKVFLKLVLGEDVPVTLDTLKLVDEDLASSLIKLRGLAVASKTPSVEPQAVDIEDLALDFTIPGYDIELRPDGRETSVTASNVEEYIDAVVDAIVGRGAQAQVQAFREGFSKVFPIIDLQAFSADELAMLFGNTDEDWSIETLSEALKADHGFNVESRAIRDLVEIMSEYDAPSRRGYLQFITGSPKLPIGGFRGLNPPLTVVRKPHESPLTADDYLPSVMTCVNYLKLPDYSSKEVMRQKLFTAMKEGVGSFHLS